MASIRWFVVLTLASALSALAHAGVPQVISYQGRVSVAGVPFAGPVGLFRFALVSSTGVNLWTNDGTRLGTSNAPTASVNVPVAQGFYTVLLGSTGMATLDPMLFRDNSNLKLRVWFSDGAHGLQQLSPDFPLTATPYALVAAQVALNGATPGSLGAGSVRGTVTICSGAAQNWANALVYVPGTSAMGMVDPDTRAYELTYVPAGTREIRLKLPSGAVHSISRSVPTGAVLTGADFLINDCNDNSACTTDTCDAVNGCSYTPVTCNDDNACTTDTCDADTGCLHTTVTCNDHNDCTTDDCNPAIGCTATALTDGTLCDDSNACTEDDTCQNGQCVGDAVDCNDGNPCTIDHCETEMGGCWWDPIYNNVCADNAICEGIHGCACDSGYENCNMDLTLDGCEINTNTDLNNCGGCGVACSTIGGTPDCNDGLCSITCNPGYGDCGPDSGCETNLTTSTTNCGACGIACSFANGVATCNNSTCVLASCNTGYANCDNNQATGCEANLRTNVAHCGACGNMCYFANASAACNNSTCVIASCNTGYGNCDANQATGCETNLRTNASHCGACGNVCAFVNASAACNNGTCVIGSCNTGYGNCDNNQATGCETNLRTSATNCGACGNVCAVGKTCVNGTCQ